MNKSDFLNSLRDETIQEYLNADKNRSSFIAHQIRESVNRFEPALDVDKYEQMNELELRNTTATVNEIKVKLLDIFNNLNTLSNDASYETTKYSKLYNKVGNYTVILIDYNKMITLYLTTTNNIATRQNIYSTMMQTKELYLKLGEVAYQILIDYARIDDKEIRRKTIKKYFVKILLLWSLFGLINGQFNNNQYSVIAEQSILTNINSFAPEWIKYIIEYFKLEVELYGIPTPPPPAGKAPGGGLDWQPPGGPGGPPGGPSGPGGGDSRGGPRGPSGSEDPPRGPPRGGPSGGPRPGQGPPPFGEDFFGPPPEGYEPEPHYPAASSSTGRSTELFTQIQQQRQQFPTEEGTIQAEEQYPDTRRTVPQQEVMPTTPQQRGEEGSEGETFHDVAEAFDIASPEKPGYVNIGLPHDPIWVKHEKLPEEKIKDLSEAYSGSEEGRKDIVDVLEKIPAELSYIVERTSLPLNDKQRMERYFSDYDKTKLVCFIFICSTFKKLSKGGESFGDGSINDIDTLVFKVADYIFGIATVKWTEDAFKTMEKDTLASNFIENLYVKIMGSEMDYGVTALFENLEQLPPLEEVGESEEVAPQAEEAQPDEGEDEEEEEVVPSSEGEEEPAEEEDVEETVEDFEEERKKLSDTLKSYREVLEKAFNALLLNPAKEGLKAGKAVTLTILGKTYELTVDVLQYIVDSPGPLLGFIVFAYVGDYIPVQGDGYLWDFGVQFVAKETKKAAMNAPGVKTIMSLFGKDVAHKDPEFDIWQNLYYKFISGLVGAKWGTIGNLVLDLLNKLLYRIKIKDRYKYPIPEGNVVLDMLSISKDMAMLSAGGAGALLYKKKKKFKKPAKQLMIQWQDELQKALQQIQDAKEKGPIEDTPQKQVYPHPAQLELQLPKSSPSSSPTVKSKHVVSTDEQHNPDLTSGSEAADEGIGDITKVKKKAAKTSVQLDVGQPSGASSSSASKSTIHASSKKKTGKGFIKGRTLKPIDERYIIGSAAPLLYNDLENDSFLVKPRSAEPVV